MIYYRILIDNIYKKYNTYIFKSCELIIRSLLKYSKQNFIDLHIRNKNNLGKILECFGTKFTLYLYM